MALPDHFCWTRFGTEAGQTAQAILHRKEQERSANNGVFLWGIGNSVGPGIKELARMCEFPEVLFSPIKSPPRTLDAAPECVVAWTVGETSDGTEFPLPYYSLVTSRLNTSSPKKTHYALVCYSSEPLYCSSSPHKLEFSALRNLLSGNPVGASQVTAIVRREATALSEGCLYDVPLRAHLVPPFFIRLHEPMAFTASWTDMGDWYSVVQKMWNERVTLFSKRTREGKQAMLPLRGKPDVILT